jgi:DinB superfamily
MGEKSMKNSNHQQITETRVLAGSARASQRAEALAIRLESGATALADLASTLSDAEWQTRLPRDGRKIGVVVHHVASMYPIEIQLARLLAAGQPITGVTWDAVDTINRDHAIENDNVTKEAALALLKTNSAAAAQAIRAFTDAELDRAAPVSLNSDAPLTCQFFLEDHPVRHSYHHLARIKAALGTSASLAVC